MKATSKANMTKEQLLQTIDILQTSLKTAEELLAKEVKKNADTAKEIRTLYEVMDSHEKLLKFYTKIIEHLMER